jgi:hypothetical protein
MILHISNWVSLICERKFQLKMIDLMLFVFLSLFPFKSCLISRGVSLISWTSLNAWNESEIILIMNIELIQFIKKTFVVECVGNRFQKIVPTNAFCWVTLSLLHSTIL